MTSKTAQTVKQQATPVLALITAIAGYLASRTGNEEALRRADREAESARIEAERFADERARRAYTALEQAVEIQAVRVEDLEAWVVELEGFVEDHVEEDSPRSQREREAREERLAKIRASKARRQWVREVLPPSPVRAPSYDEVQSTDDDMDFPHP